jgi:hypothetical protein
MKTILIMLIFIVTFSGCNHYKWATKNKDKICHLCPSTNESFSYFRDSVIYTTLPADTFYIEGLDFPNDLTVDNNNYTLQKDRNRVKIITKEKEVPVYINKYIEKHGETKVIEITKTEKKVPFWYWVLLPVAFILGYLFRKLFNLF